MLKHKQMTSSLQQFQSHIKQFSLFSYFT
jgi:hypothetical protein